MHDKFINYGKEWIPSPTIPRYLVSVDGRILDSKTGNVLPHNLEGDEPRVQMETPYGPGYASVAKFVMEVYKPHFIADLMVKGIVRRAWIDGDVTNCHAGNLIWLYDKPIEVYGHGGFFYIPDFTKYAINREGVVISIQDGRVCNGTIAPTGYVTNSLMSDWGVYISGYGRHRSMAMAFNGYPKDVYDMVTNHLNGIPGDDRPENVEICTYSDNINHAYATGLRSDNTPVGVMDHKTGTVASFYSYGKAAEYIGTSPSNIFNSLQQDATYLYRDRWQFSVVTEDGAYVFPPAVLRVVGGRGAVVQLMDKSGKVQSFPSVSAAADHIGVSRARYKEYIRTNIQLWYGGYRGKQSEWSPWKDISDYKQELLARRNVFATYRITNLDSGESGLYFNLKGLELPGWKLKQLEEHHRIAPNRWQYKHYLIEKLPPPFQVLNDMSPLEETQEVVSH